MEEILSYVSNNGFAIVVAIYMIVYNNKTLQTLSEAINKQTTMIETILKERSDIDE